MVCYRICCCSGCRSSIFNIVPAPVSYTHLAAEVEPDKQGRILIPQPLRDYASIEKDVTFIGTGDRAEIWSTECWTQFNDNLTEDSIAEAMDALSF